MKRASFLILVLGASGCANMSGWQPTVDVYGDPNAANLQYDMQECQKLAQKASGTLKEAIMGAGTGGIVGGAGGAAVGAVIGNPAVGAALGAAGVGVVGGTYAGIKADERYKSTYNQCLRGRGHRVLY